MEKYPLMIDADEVETIGADEFKIRVSAFFSQRNQPVQGTNIQFYVAGKATSNLVPTDENGRAEEEVMFTSLAKSIAIEALAVGTNFRARKLITLPREAKKSGGKPTKMFVRAVGKDGDYVLIISVNDENGRPCKDVRINIMDDEADDKEGRVRYVQTDDCGTVREEDKEKVKIIFPEEERKFVVKALGTDIEEEHLTLPGPPKWRKPSKVPEPSQDDLEGGLLETVISAWEKGSEDLDELRGGTK